MASAQPDIVRVAEELRRIPSLHATAAIIDRCEWAIQQLSNQAGSALWNDLQAQLAAFLLDCPEGDRADNVRRAEQAYRQILAYSSAKTSPEAWRIGVVGLADALVAAPSAGQAAFDEAIAVYRGAIGELMGGNDAPTLALVLGNCADAIEGQPEGDKALQLEESLFLRKEAVGLLSPSNNPARWGSAMHNLGIVYLKRKRGIRTQNIDDAITALRQALTVRTVESNPVGRVRTLRALAAAYPEWTGADSLEHAQTLADAASREADSIEESDPNAARRNTGWMVFARRKSALTIDFDDYLKLPPEEQMALFSKMAAFHKRALQEIPRDSMPSLWADWAGGCGRALAQFPRLGDGKYVQAAHECFQDSLATLAPLDEPRLRLEVLRRAGEFYHEIGAFEASFPTYAAALETGDLLIDWAATSENRERELSEVRGFALLGAYAAARQNKLAEAVELAERGRARTLVETLAASELALSEAPEAVRTQVAAIQSRIGELEEQYRQAQQNDPMTIAADLRAKLVDFAGVDPSALGMRLNRPADSQSDESAPELIRISSELAQARAELRSFFRPGAPLQLSAQDIANVATRARYPLIYLFVTSYGGVALAVLPDTSLAAIPLAGIDSDQTIALLHGDGGYIRAAAYSGEESIGDALGACLPVLRDGVMDPLSVWLSDHGFTHAALIPLGSLGLLPLHASRCTATPTYTYAPSARALSYALTSRERRAGAVNQLLAVGDPADNLPLAGAEAWSVGARFEPSRKTILLASAATAEAVSEAAPSATHLHLSCHGRFRPADPRASSLLLAGEDALTLGQILSGTLDLSSVRLTFLSACQSGSQEFRNVPDESMGFPSGFLLAGTPGVVSAFWLVDSGAAALFARRFYEQHIGQGLEPADAVEQSRQWLRTATAADLATYVDVIRSEVRQAGGASSDAWDTALSALWRDLISREPDECPFALPEHWAAFAYTGA